MSQRGGLMASDSVWVFQVGQAGGSIVAPADVSVEMTSSPVVPVLGPLGQVFSVNDTGAVYAPATSPLAAGTTAVRIKPANPGAWVARTVYVDVP